MLIANLMWSELYIAAELWVSSMKSRGLSSQPLGAHVLSVVVLGMLLLFLSD